MKNSEKWFEKLNKGYLLDSKNKGPVSIILAGIHGNEVCGVNALLDIVPDLKINSGKVYFVFGNPRAIEQKVRQTEFNLNRAFRPAKFYTPLIKKSYEYKRAQFLKKILNKTEVSLDIHSTKNKNKPFIICEANAKEIIKTFPKNLVREVYGFGTIEPGATDDYMDRNGKIGITIECGQHKDSNSLLIAKKSVFAFLQARGHIQTKKILKKSIRPTFRVEKLYITKSKSFTLKKDFPDFSPIKKGTIIGTDGEKVIKSDRSGFILFAHNCQEIGQEAYVLGKKINNY